MAPEYWACARLRGGHERLAVHCLTTVAGYMVYQPQLIERRVARGRKVNVTAPLFPGYIFVLIVGGQWWSAAYSPGVIALLRNGDGPARVPDSVVEELRRRESRDGYIRLPRAARPAARR